jgi:glycosyltransferase involved in cell wall biosynthesis
MFRRLFQWPRNRQRPRSPSFLSSVSSRAFTLSAGRRLRKDHDLLIGTFEQVLERHPQATLTIAGVGGSTLEDTRKLIRDRGLDFRVELPHDQIPYLLAGTGLFVLCSRWIPGKMGEAFPLVILEAAAAARPVASTRSTGVEEIIRDGATSRLTPREDIPAWPRRCAI